MDGDDSGGEDEWASLRRRFSMEGMDWGDHEPSARTLHVWHWVVDAEANLKAARHINDKLRRQHDEEKGELEAYSSHLRQKFEEKVRALEGEAGQLRGDLEALMAGAGAVATMMQQEGLHDLANSSLGEQIAYLLVERSRLMEELTSARTRPASDREKDLTAQLIKSCTDLELLKRLHQETENQLMEMTDRVRLLEKASHQVELDNETLAYKLSEALAELEDNEGQLRRFIKNPNFRRGESPRTSLRSLDECSLHSGVFRRESSRGSGRHKKSEPIRVERGKSPRNSQRRHHRSRSGSVAGREGVDGASDNDGADGKGKKMSTPGMNKDSSKENYVEQPSTTSTLPPHTLTDNTHSLKEEIKKLQDEVEALRKELLVAEDKYEYTVRKYELYKIKSKNKVSAIKLGHQSQCESLNRKLSKLEGELSLRSDQLNAEESFRQQLEGDLSTIRQERQDMATRVRECERVSQDRSQEISLLREKVELIRETNKQLSEKLKELTAAAIVG
ncbi:hypothetical protein Pcinc_038274 [Petrolisthes cinctipes]|uniref:Uncharacterized protein n=1 Tax=Petrolisthes cinctipes TaxID=88211 RepID=A0AAE1BUA4_PETCI|nr:hypothetical protein Pcinc_038274 [Petrolisthes cinctipes]